MQMGHLMPTKRRWVENVINKELACSNTVILSGVRQCGKTTFLTTSLPENSAHVLLNNLSFLRQAQRSPEAFLKRCGNSKSLIAIDDLQLAPELFPEINRLMGTGRCNSHLILSLSCAPRHLTPGTESYRDIRLRPLTEGEIQSSSPRLFERLSKDDFTEDISFEECNKEAILQKSLQGGFPGVDALSVRSRQVRFKQLVDCLQNDFLKLTHARKNIDFPHLLKCCALHSGQSLNLSETATELKLSRPTLTAYIKILQQLCVIDKIPAWQPGNIVTNSAKSQVFMCDSGLMSHLVGIALKPADTLMYDSKRSVLVEQLIKTWVYQQLAPITDLDHDWSLYHYRNRQGKEIDFILENMEGDLICIEVKSSEGIKSDHFKHLRWFREQFGQNRRMKTIVFYCGTDVCQYSKDEYALPMAYLWK